MIHHTTNVRVRYPDTDKMGVVYHGVYVEYLETGRTEMLRDLGLANSALEESGVMLPVLEVCVAMRRPARYDEVLTVHTYLRRPIGARMQLEYEIYRDAELLATGRTSHAFTTVDTMKPVRPPKALLDLLAAADDGTGLKEI
ncbi:MAG: acyl-CoA thioesterase [Bacteroidetes bacterium]|nr:acyl-CoA thioesterase [Bacteroidota bacterium]